MFLHCKKKKELSVVMSNVIRRKNCFKPQIFILKEEEDLEDSKPLDCSGKDIVPDKEFRLAKIYQSAKDVFSIILTPVKYLLFWLFKRKSCCLGSTETGK